MMANLSAEAIDKRAKEKRRAYIFLVRKKEIVVTLVERNFVQQITRILLETIILIIYSRVRRFEKTVSLDMNAYIALSLYWVCFGVVVFTYCDRNCLSEFVVFSHDHIALAFDRLHRLFDSFEKTNMSLFICRKVCDKYKTAFYVILRNHQVSKVIDKRVSFIVHTIIVIHFSFYPNVLAFSSLYSITYDIILLK